MLAHIHTYGAILYLTYLYDFKPLKLHIYIFLSIDPGKPVKNIYKV